MKSSCTKQNLVHRVCVDRARRKSSGAMAIASLTECWNAILSDKRLSYAGTTLAISACQNYDL
jgi:hypothetical protein